MNQNGYFKSAIYFSLLVAVYSNKSIDKTITYYDTVMLDCNRNSSAAYRWEYNGELIFSNGINVGNKAGYKVQLQENGSLYIGNVTLDHEGTYVCFTDTGVLTSYRLHVKVSLLMYFTVCDSEIVTEVYTETKSKLTLTCHANGTTPNVELVWLHDYNDLGGSICNIEPVIQDGNSIYHSSLSMTIKPFPGTTFITCLSKGTISEANVSATLKVVTFATAQTIGERALENLLVIVAVVGSISSCLLVCACFTVRKFRLSRIRRGNQHITPSHQMNVLDKEPLDIDQSINQKGGRRKELPEITVDEDNSQNSHHSEGSEPNYYSTADAIAGNDPRMLSEKDVSIIINIKMGKIYKRWMGSVNLVEETNKCVVVTTLTEKLIRKKEIHWETFIRKCLELPASNHLAKIEAISIQSSKLFLISEHLNCENLHSVLSRDTKDKGDYYCCSSLSVPDVIEYVTGVLEGMDILKTFGFLHPGLTTKKVLLTKKGQVKLFDFCLAGDAQKVAALKKSQIPTVTLNQFPPEMLLLNQYTESSDVWSTAVVIWEIMAAGNPPFPVENKVRLDEEATTPSVPWPEKYLQIKDQILFDCWNHNSSLRPSIHHLRGTFVAVFEKLIMDSSYEIPIPTTYLPMSASNTTQPTNAEQIYHAGCD